VTQCDLILDHLERGGTLTPMSAFHTFEITRLAARVLDLRRKGYPIQTDKIKTQSGYVAQYWLVR
jgi:hypothetical protein